MEWINAENQMPESGVPVIVAVINEHGQSRRLRAAYAAPMTLPVGLEQDEHFADYDDKTDEYYCPAGWYEENEYEDVHWRVGGTVTHWQLMPDLPDGHNKSKQADRLRRHLFSGVMPNGGKNGLRKIR